MTEFSSLDILPMKSADFAGNKVKIYEQPDFDKIGDLRSLVFDCISAIARLSRHIHYKISNETNRFQDQSMQAELKYKQLNDYKEILNRLVLYMDILKTNGSVGDPDKLARMTEVSKEVKRIQIEIA